MSGSETLPPAAVLLGFRVADFDAWKTVFDANEPDRIDNGVLGHHINRAEDDPNRLDVYLAIGDEAKARTWLDSDELKSTMASAGVLRNAPEFTWMTPVRESIVWDRELPAFMVRHQVADFDEWLAGYDAADEVRRSSGIVGDAANRSMEDPSIAIVYHQAESFDDLRSFLESDDLRLAMKEAGVVSDPDVTFHTGGWAKRYR